LHALLNIDVVGATKLTENNTVRCVRLAMEQHVDDTYD
jgi:hypothetical protein